MKMILRKTKLILSNNELALLENLQIQLRTWGRWRKWRELAMDGPLAFAVQDVPSEALAFSNKAEDGYKYGLKLAQFPSQFFRSCCLVK